MGSNVFDLIILKGPQEGKKLRFQTDAVTIGRKFNNTLVINAPMVSGTNTKIFLENDQFVIEDLQSLNGTFVNNKKVERFKLVSGDKIEIGSALLLFMRKGEEPVARTGSDSEESLEKAAEQHKTMIMGKITPEMLGKKPADAGKAKPGVSRNPVVLILIVLIVLVSIALGYLTLKPKPVPKAGPKAVKTETTTAAVTPTEPEIVIPRIERGDLTTTQIVAKAEDHFNRAKQAYASRKIKDDNLHQAIGEFKQSLAYLQLTDEQPAWQAEVMPMLKAAVIELNSSYDEAIFLARKFSRQNNYSEARKYHEKIMRMIPDTADERFQASDKAIKYFISKNFIKP